MTKEFFKILSNKRLVLLLIFLFIKINAQTCGGTFGDPIFNETFGSTTNSWQTIAPALVSPAFTNYNYTSNFPPNDGYYTISNSTSWPNWTWQNSLDHTIDAPGTYGNMLIVNASYTPGEFYRRRVSNLCSNQIYRFSAWVLNIHGNGNNVIKPNVTMQIKSISGTILGTVSTGDIIEGPDWHNYYLDFKSDPSSSQVDVVLINNAPGGIGNDLAIDDITFSPCGPSTSISADIGILNSGVCDNSQNFQLSANLSSNTFLNVNFIWQKSTDGGLSWVSVTAPTSNPTLNILAGTYQNNDQYRFIVGEAANILSSTCQVISSPSILKVSGYPNAPTVQPINFCQNSIASSLSAIGNNLLWYPSLTGGIGSSVAPVPNTSVLGTTSYWVSQTVNGCESPRSEIKVMISPIPQSPFVSDSTFCQNSVVYSLTAIGNNLLWYPSVTGGIGSSVAPVPNTSVLGTTSYWVSQTVNGCESPRSEIKVTISPLPQSPLVSDSTYCQNSIVSSLSAIGSNLLWYPSVTGGIGSSVAPVPNTSVLGTTSYWVSQTVNGCESPRSEIKVTISPIPQSPLVSDYTYCQNSVVSSLSAIGSNLLWYPSVTGGIGSSVAPVPNTSVLGTTSYWVSQTVNGCESQRTEIKVTISPIPQSPLVSDSTYCQNSIASSLSAIGNNLLWYPSVTGGIGSSVAPVPNTSVLGTISYWVSQTVNGCESPRSEIKINILPQPHSTTLVDATICNGDTVILDAGSGFASYVWNTTPPTYSQTLVVSQIGTYSVSLMGNNGCSATQSVNVTAGIIPKIDNIISTDSSIEIFASGGNSPYLYSLDNAQNWQSSNVFTNIIPGVYKVFVKSQINSCIISEETAVVFIPNSITPNGDAFNDVFKINYIKYFPNAKLTIYDRFGKKIFSSKNNTDIDWDGTFNGRILPSSTYWYTLDFGNGSKKTGWILLKNRN